MKGRCGLEDCDCEYTIAKLLAALKGLGNIVRTTNALASRSIVELREFNRATYQAEDAIAQAEGETA